MEAFMLAYTYIDKDKFALEDKPVPKLCDPRDAVVKVTLASILLLYVQSHGIRVRRF